ncbi:GNAT family N-acetyltransferase [Grimontia sp. S25]|uniref:GNAT family N-acetyltransferase n=1 Tax=Grimontia sedimenti TaxID=2711294 RepID=A0A6M1RFT0_9GAMM|nr:GNAT family N-acetyltransferase [Grimontia sedimenti]NGN97151.1 GNAT family N-acetyltransferase [Grimontia sedimenti]
MLPQPQLETKRLVLRPFTLSDSEIVAKLAGDKRIADMTANIPHPYELNMAKTWIATHQAQWESGKGAVYAVTLKSDQQLIGTVSFPSIEEDVGVLGYWIGVPYWGNGYAVEASRALIDFAKEHLGMKYLEVMHLVENQQSQSVIEKLGVEYTDTRTNRMQGKERPVKYYRSKL